MLALSVLLSLHAGPPRLPIIEAVPVVEETFQARERLSGTILPAARVKLVARVSGQVVRIAKPDGGTVKEGELLFRLDDSLCRIESAKAEALLKRCEARLFRATADADRLARLRRTGGASQEEFDRAVSAKQEAAAEADAAKADLMLAKWRLAACSITAPIAGRVGRSMLDTGGLAKADETHLATIEGEGPLHLMLDVEAKKFRKVFDSIRAGGSPAGKESMEVEVLPAGGKRIVGRIDHIDEMPDPTSKTGRVRVRLPAGAAVAPGEAAEAWVKTDAPFRAVRLPYLSSDAPEIQALVVDKEGRLRSRDITGVRGWTAATGFLPGDRLIQVQDNPHGSKHRLEGTRFLVAEPLRWRRATGRPPERPAPR